VRTLVIIASLVLAFTQVALAASRQEHMAKTLAGCKNFMRDPKNAHPKQKHANGSQLLELRWKDGRATKRGGSPPTSPSCYCVDNGEFARVLAPSIPWGVRGQPSLSNLPP
jgi:hypothetical protein